MKKIFAYGLILVAVSLFVLGCQKQQLPAEEKQPVVKDALTEEESNIDADLAEIDTLSKDLDAAAEEDISAQLDQI